MTVNISISMQGVKGQEGGQILRKGVKSFDLTNSHLFAIDSTWQDN